MSGPASEIFRANLRLVRTGKNITQIDAAARMTAAGHSINQSLWSAYERGDKTPSLDQASRMAEAIGTTLRRLLRPPTV